MCQLVARHGLHLFPVHARWADKLARSEPGVPFDEVQVCHVHSDEFVHLKGDAEARQYRTNKTRTRMDACSIFGIE